MTVSPLVRWHDLVNNRNPQGLDALLSDGVVFHSPVVHTPQVGKAVTTQYLTAGAARLLQRLIPLCARGRERAGGGT
jgi:hypothetical protein